MRSRVPRWLMAVVLGLLLGLSVPTSTARLVAQGRQAMRGLVLKVDRAARAVLVSHEAVPDVMPSMTMAFEVRAASELEGITVGMLIDFVLVTADGEPHAEQLRVRRYAPVDQDPLTAGRLRILADAMRPPSSPRTLAAGAPVPDFTLTDQVGQQVSLASLRGRAVAVNFFYTSCALPQFCFRIASHFGALHRRFTERLGRDLVLLSITFDPTVDQPDVLAKYAAQWKASPASWHFLTGPADEIRRVCDLFGVDAFPEEGLMNHTVRTAIIDRDGTLVTIIEGNEYTSAQLGDLVASVMDR